MSNKYLDIEDIPKVPQAIKEAVSREKLVLFIGAGVSRLLNCPSWKRLASRVIEHIYSYRGQNGKYIDFREKTDLESLEPRKALSICDNIINTKGLQNPNFEEFFNPKELDSPNVYDTLFKFNAINITTNYDLFLYKAAERHFSGTNETIVENKSDERNKILVSEHIKPKIIFRDDEFSTAKLSIENIFYLHGVASDRDSMIITISDYLVYHLPNSTRANFLRKIFSEYTVLFVGYGLEEYEILEFLVSKYFKRNHDDKMAEPGKEIKHYMLYSVFKNEASLYNLNNSYYLNLGIQLEPYPKDDKGYNQLINVLENWAIEIGPKFKRAEFLDKVSVIEDII